jgi:hypothetical protein
MNIFLNCLIAFNQYLSANSNIPLIRFNQEGETSQHAENPNNFIFLSKYATLAVCSSTVTIYSMYLRLKRGPR